MSKFKNVKAQNAENGATREYLMYEVLLGDENPILTVAHMGSSNEEFANAMIEEQMREESVPVQYRNVTGKSKEHFHRKNSETLAKYIIRDWKNVVDDKGKEVKFNVDDCIDFLTSLSANKLGRLVEFCQDEYNFSKAGSMTADQKEEAAKNSQGDSSSS